MDPTKNDKANPVDHEIEKIIYHEEYSNDRKINDIGLIKTKTKMQFNCKYRKQILLIIPNFIKYYVNTTIV